MIVGFSVLNLSKAYTIRGVGKTMVPLSANTLNESPFCYTRTMELIKQLSFELAIYKRGDENAEKLMLCLPGRLDTKDYPNPRGHVHYFSKTGYLAVSFHTS